MTNGKTMIAVLAAGLAFAPCASLRAAEVAYPKVQPAFTLDVPSEWKMDRTTLGLEARSPESDSLLIASVLKRDRPRIDDWVKKVVAKMEAFGVGFDAKAKAPPPAPPPAPEKPTAGGTSTDFTKTPGSFTFSGAPALSATEGASRQTANLLESLTDPAKTVDVKQTPHRFRVVRYAGTSLKGKPVDVEFAVSDLPGNRVFVVMQESGSDDNRAAAIVNSFKAAKPGKIASPAARPRVESKAAPKPDPQVDTGAATNSN